MYSNQSRRRLCLILVTVGGALIQAARERGIFQPPDNRTSATPTTSATTIGEDYTAGVDRKVNGIVEHTPSKSKAITTGHKSSATKQKTTSNAPTTRSVVAKDQQDTTTSIALLPHDPEKRSTTTTTTMTSPITVSAYDPDSTIKAAAIGSGDRNDITWLYILVAVAALVLLILLICCLCLWCRQPKGPYKPKLHFAEIDIIEGGIAKPMFVDVYGKAFSVEGTPKSISSPKSFQL